MKYPKNKICINIGRLIPNIEENKLKNGDVQDIKAIIKMYFVFFGMKKTNAIDIKIVTDIKVFKNFN